ncbi:hypothetical protein [Mycobacterium leprae]|uniref:hypothetical protein n=1 Tax=Mycobacterium leprae TaxID=1769 RepID=UPI000AEA9E94|nr:hypothetical protein [Mycobacterium leprae]
MINIVRDPSNPPKFRIPFLIKALSAAIAAESINGIQHQWGYLDYQPLLVELQRDQPT